MSRLFAGIRMHECRAPILAVALLTAAAPLLVGQRAAPREQLLVSVDWLADHYRDADLVLLHVGPEEAYAREHLPGARYFARDEFSHPGSHQRGALVLELPEPEALEAALRRFGVSEDSRIVVYWGEEWVTPTARVVFTLDWAGLGENTMLLDGGLGAWKAAGHPVTDAIPQVSSGDVTVRPRSELVTDAAGVRARARDDGYALVDGRARVFFDGVREDRGKAGHIPGAGSVPWTELIDEALRLKPPAALRALFSSAGVARGDTVVAYCHIGQYATLVLFAARTLGHDVVLYDGAFQDWAARDLPVAGGGR